MPRTTNNNGELTFEYVAVTGETLATHEYAAYPLKFLRPTSSIAPGFHTSVICILGYGGGLVSRDHTKIVVDAGDSTSVVLCTQATTKVFKCIPDPARADDRTKQDLHVSVRANATFLLLPDPVTCYANAKYCQRQTFNVDPTATLVVLDWLTSGRLARGEHWAFDTYESCNEIYITHANGPSTPLVVDRLRLRQDETIPLRTRMGGMHVMGTLVLCGPRVMALVAQLLTDGARKQLAPHQAPVPSGRLAQSSLSDVRSAVSPLGPNGAILRFGAHSTDAAYAYIKDILAPLRDVVGYTCFQENR
ncbi:hypothetical protein SPRG_06019 [Saprolegnia parasitica CBS 223.65]|uniref:Urease accessory protein UreD n=1 Tax=Saprolegnia parasitica (strain CBS 223.65) TaxID=695850 RepID=A0A067CJV7_SAPPC|nr:hypothetical protein SPRG_06019 [Saprolegnia parasitica CBS 223.65]KDO29480.1 hypothetical protein SPRG_06019 [Saprolegnia parasitica CBS 223.65]|eukprot:XP_012199977.1 hypothetical protein SPRG_06019 [Saprolegnia parasitica CBS 223.65]